MEGEQKQEKVLVQFKNLQTGKWEGPAEVKLTGRGYMCLLTDNGVRWIPVRWVSHVGRDSCSPSRRFVLHRKANIVYPTYQRFFDLQ